MDDGRRRRCVRGVGLLQDRDGCAPGRDRFVPGTMHPGVWCFGCIWPLRLVLCAWRLDQEKLLAHDRVVVHKVAELDDQATPLLHRSPAAYCLQHLDNPTAAQGSALVPVWKVFFVRNVCLNPKMQSWCVQQSARQSCAVRSAYSL